MKNIFKIYAIAVFSLLYFLSCAGASHAQEQDQEEGVVKINYNELRQEIDGFGGSNAWTSLPGNRTTARELVTMLYSKTEGIGLTILRNRIPFRERLAGDKDPNVNDNFVTLKSDKTYNYTENAEGTKTFNLNWNAWDISNTRNLISQIKALGGNGPEKLTIMSSPWTPPNNRVTQWKEDVKNVSAKLDAAIDWSTPDVWGRLRRDKYEDYADLLADYAKNFEDKMGAPLDIISIQNEPNWKTDYESAYWDGIDLRDFLLVMEERFPKKGVTLGEGGLGVMMPEFENFDINFNDMIKPSLDAPNAEKILTHIALHQYNANFDSSGKTGAKAFPGITASGKRFWQTEVSGSGPAQPAGLGIDNAIFFAKMIHYDFTLVEMNAFLFWWLWSNSGSTTGSLIRVEGNDVLPAKRFYAMGQFSRFIRPGWHLIISDTAPRIGVHSSAYRNPNTKEIAIVLINERNSTLDVTLDLNEAEFAELNIWRTSENESLSSIGRQRISRGKATISLPPKSITTLYGNVK